MRYVYISHQATCCDFSTDNTSNSLSLSEKLVGVRMSAMVNCESLAEDVGYGSWWWLATRLEVPERL